MRCLVTELSRIFYSHTQDQTVLTIWLSHLIENMREQNNRIFENYLAALFGCDVVNVWPVAEAWMESLLADERGLDNLRTCAS